MPQIYKVSKSFCQGTWKPSMLWYFLVRSHFHAFFHLLCCFSSTSVRVLNGIWRGFLWTLEQSCTVSSRTMRRWGETGLLCVCVWVCVFVCFTVRVCVCMCTRTEWKVSFFATSINNSECNRSFILSDLDWNRDCFNLADHSRLWHYGYRRVRAAAGALLLLS